MEAAGVQNVSWILVRCAARGVAGALLSCRSDGKEVLSHLLEDGQTGAVVAEQVPRPAPGVSSLF